VRRVAARLRGAGSSFPTWVGLAARYVRARTGPFVRGSVAGSMGRAGGLSCGRMRFSPRGTRSRIGLQTGTRATLVGACWRRLFGAVAGRAFSLGLGEGRAGPLHALAAQWGAALAGRGARRRRGFLELERGHAGIGACATVPCGRLAATLHEVVRAVALPTRGYCISNPA
jgi:hypothetical protein